MAGVTSLGVHTPTALPYLINEGILPPEPKRDLYQWETYVFAGIDGDVEEEVVATKGCVVWSQSKLVRTVYRFELEGEDVRQAVLTKFPKGIARPQPSSKEVDKATSKYGKSGRTSLAPRQIREAEPHAQDATSNQHQSDRALVVFLKTKAHIYFLYGSHHIVDLPFEVDRAFAAPCGLLLQRKFQEDKAIDASPEVPAPPQNSFFSSQLHPTSSYLLSPTLGKSFNASQPTRPSPLGGDGGANEWLNRLFTQVCGTPDRWNEREAAGLYSLTSPFSEPGMLTESIQHSKPRVTTKAPHGLTVEFEALDRAETIAYVSTEDELSSRKGSGHGPLTLVVTVNASLRLATVWHAWYIEEHSLADLMKRRAESKAAKSRRRSSFLSGSHGLGTATPGLRHRDGGRESFAPGASLHVPGDATSNPLSRSLSRKQTRQDDEEAMASQMDPDFLPTGSQQPTRESRRISSIVSRGEAAGQGTATASFGGTASRRHTSFGPHSERRSIGQRKSRGSTPGSVFSKSIGVEDDSMDFDFDSDLMDGQESIDSIVKHIRNTYEVAGVDNVFGSMDEGFKRELVVRKVYSFSIGPRPYASTPLSSPLAVKVATLGERLPSPGSDNHRLGVYIHDQSTGDLLSLLLEIKDRPIWPDMPSSPRVSIPIVSRTSTVGQCRDIVKLRDGDTGAVLVVGAGVLLSPHDTSLLPMPSSASYRMSDPLSVLAGPQLDKDVGKNRTIPAPDVQTVVHAGASGSFDEAGSGGTLHRRRLLLAPQDSFVGQVLDLCQLLLPIGFLPSLRFIWGKAYARLAIDQDAALAGTAADAEWAALITTILTLAIGLVDDKSRASLELRKMAGKSHRRQSSALLPQKLQHQAALFKGPAWSWMDDHVQPPSAELSPNRSQTRRDQILPIAAALANELVHGVVSRPEILMRNTPDAHGVGKLMLGLHVFREEQKLNTLSTARGHDLSPVIAQLGSWVGLDGWSYEQGQYYAFEGANDDHFAFVQSAAKSRPSLGLMDDAPVGVFEWVEHSMKNGSVERYPSLAVVAQLAVDKPLSKSFADAAIALTPRILALSQIIGATGGLAARSVDMVEISAKCQLTVEMLETLPEAVAAPFREAISRCEKEPPTTWPPSLLRLVGREDLEISAISTRARAAFSTPQLAITALPKDVQHICHALDQPVHAAKTREADRHAVSQLLFSEDRRLVEATTLMHFNSIQIAECSKQPDWSDAYHFEQQRKVMNWVTARMIALPAGDGMIHFDSQAPLMTERYHLPGFSSSCIMQPMGHTVTTDRSGLTEEKLNWAYFHAGVSVGLRISRNAKGIDTSWLVFNKPNDLTNRHAGLLLALGLNGHLRSLAKWLSFKYLTPKHTMTSVGLLLGISASYMGTMDSLITRMLSVHITSMLPPGAAELNVSPTAQTAGLMGIGLLYFNTQHRRMSEIMLHEIEIMDVTDVDNGPDMLRDESYRLAAGFALGFINLAKGKDLKSLHGMRLPERLLNVAVGPRPVHAVHVFDKATAGAVIAVALVYMKSGDAAIARRIDVPDTQAQFDHVRPDMLLLRTMAKHVILWDSIQAQSPVPGSSWIEQNLPACYKNKLASLHKASRGTLQSGDVPFYNIVTGLAWALSLKYAGSGSEAARDGILHVLDAFWAAKSVGDAYYYDGKLARSSLRRCIDVLALAAAAVMAGTGDLKTFRYLRRLHGRTDAETPYGSHLAAHLAIGVLFLGGGTYTLGTSDLAVAALITAFYPLFPTDVHDNRVHLQAFRHLWIFAAEARCLVAEDIDTRRPVPMPLIVTLRTGEVRAMQSPCLLPELSSIATVHTADPSYWRVTLDFASNPSHLAAFQQNQRVSVRRCPAAEAHSSSFSATLAALNSTQSAPTGSSQEMWDWVFSLPSLRPQLDKADTELILSPDVRSSVHTDARGTVIDDRLVLAGSVGARDRDALWNLRVLFAWAERAEREGQGKLAWIGRGVVEGLRAEIGERMSKVGEAV